MSSDIERDDADLAAEVALGLLEGEELLTARGRMASDPAFAAEVEQWQARLSPLLDEMAGAEPSPDLWQRIEAEISARAESEDSKVVDLQNRLKRWQWTAGLTSAAAAVALAVLAFAPGTAPTPGGDTPVQLASADPLYANVPIAGTELALDLTYIPERQSLLVTAIGLAPDGVHDHELWLVPPEGELISLGVVTPGQVIAHDVPDDAARVLANGSGLLLTREPLGGKPTGEAAGPVVAESTFTTV